MWAFEGSLGQAEGANSGAIKPAECLRRLTGDGSPEGLSGGGGSDLWTWSEDERNATEEARPPAHEIGYKLEDLFGEQQQPEVVRLDQRLELLVEPQSVRVLKLVQL